MNNLAELWKERQKRKVKPYKRYRYPGNKREINSEPSKRLNKDGPLTSTIYDLIPLEIKEKLNKI